MQEEFIDETGYTSDEVADMYYEIERTRVYPKIPFVEVTQEGIWKALADHRIYFVRGEVPFDEISDAYDNQGDELADRFEKSNRFDVFQECFDTAFSRAGFFFLRAKPYAERRGVSITDWECVNAIARDRSEEPGYLAYQKVHRVAVHEPTSERLEELKNCVGVYVSHLYCMEDNTISIEDFENYVAATFISHKKAMELKEMAPEEIFRWFRLKMFEGSKGKARLLRNRRQSKEIELREKAREAGKKAKFN